MKDERSSEKFSPVRHSAPIDTRGTYRLIYLDLDGTLVGRDDIVSDRTVAALHQAQQRGVTLVICTARNPYRVERIADQIGGRGYGIFSNGAIVREWQTQRVLRKTALSAWAVQAGARLAASHDLAPLCFGVDVESDGGRAVYTLQESRIPSTYRERNQHRLIYLEDIGKANICPTIIEAFGERWEVETLACAWRDELSDTVSIHTGWSQQYQCWSAHMYSSEVSKATAAAGVADLLRVPRECTLAIGDQLNDLELLHWAGLGICMGDGHEDARMAADHVTGTLADDGVAQAIEKFVLD